MENNDFIDTVDEFRSEGTLYFSKDCFLDRFEIFILLIITIRREARFLYVSL